MCAQFILKASRRQLERKYGVRSRKSGGEDDEEIYELRVVPYRPGPVIIMSGGRRRLRTMQYSLVPAWSKSRRVKFATHNARLETVASKPTWSRPFRRRRCLVPLSDFIEPIYEGEWAGNMVMFHPPGSGILTAAGIWDEWVGKDGEVVDSFAIITDEPIPFVRDSGHDRTPVFLREEGFDEWLRGGERDSGELRSVLEEYRDEPPLAVSVDRPLKAGWEKRLN